MGDYAAFLRGINVGTANRVAMADLRAVVEQLGYTGVRTLLNSGNLVFRTSASEVEVLDSLRAAITGGFGRSIDVAVRNRDELAELLAANPYPDGDPSRVTVAFLTGPPAADAEQRIADLATDSEPFTMAGREIWVNYTSGQADSKLAVQFSKVVGVSATVRNLRTVTRVAALLAK